MATSSTNRRGASAAGGSGGSASRAGAAGGSGGSASRAGAAGGSGGSASRADAAQQAVVPGQRGEGERGYAPGAAPAPDAKPMPSTSAQGIRLPAGVAGNMLWWGGLAAVAALGIVDWPVVALVAAGTWIAEQHAKQSRRTGMGS